MAPVTTNRGGDHPHPPGYPTPRLVPRWRAWLAARLVRLARRLVRLAMRLTDGAP